MTTEPSTATSCEEIEHKYNELMNKYNTLVKVCKIVMHDIRSPLRFLGDVADSLDVEKINEPDSDARKKLKLVTETSRNLYLFGTNVLDWFINNKLEISVKKEDISLADVALEISQLYTKQIKLSNNTLITEVDKDIRVHSNKELSIIILRNALDNANKYTEGGEILLKTTKDDTSVYFSIIDRGRGFDHHKLLEKLQDNSPSSSQHIGFRIIHDLAKQAGLEYDLYSERGVGTTFTLKYPINTQS